MSAIDIAFDTAWDLMKMPVIPESIVLGKDRIDARYLDSKTGEEMPINARYTDEYAGLAGLIGTNDNPLASMKAWNVGSGDAYTVSEAYTDTDRRRRGYAKELYDFIAQYLDEAGAYLLPDETQSHEMSEMWRKYASDGIWPSIRMEEGQ